MSTTTLAKALVGAATRRVEPLDERPDVAEAWAMNGHTPKGVRSGKVRSARLTDLAALGDLSRLSQADSDDGSVQSLGLPLSGSSVSVFSLAGRNDSALASSAFPSGPARAVGLTSEGRRVASAVLAAGALLDVANLSDTALFEVVELASAAHAPLLATRASARSLRARAGSSSGPLNPWRRRPCATC